MIVPENGGAFPVGKIFSVAESFPIIDGSLSHLFFFIHLRWRLYLIYFPAKELSHAVHLRLTDLTLFIQFLSYFPNEAQSLSLINLSKKLRAMRFDLHISLILVHLSFKNPECDKIKCK